MSIDMAQFHEVFFEESFEGLDIMENGLLDMDPGTVDDEQINAIFRAAHSIKGGSGTFGFNDISSFTHVMETLLGEMRDGRRPVTTDAVDALLCSVDVLREMLSATKDGGEIDEQEVQVQQAELEQILKSASAKASVAPTPQVKAGQSSVTDSALEQLGWHIVFRPLPQMMRTGNDPLRILRELAELGELEVDCDLSALPPLAGFEPEDSYLFWDLHLMGDASRETLDEIFAWIEDECELAVMPTYTAESQELVTLDKASKAASEASDSTQTVSGPSEVEQVPDRRTGQDRRSSKDRRTGDRRKAQTGGGGGSMRVDISKIDSLINMVVEGDGRHCGLFVDDLLGQQQVVIKSLEANYQRVEGISGATILGDGSVSLILDIPGLLRLGNRQEEENLKRTA